MDSYDDHRVAMAWAVLGLGVDGVAGARRRHDAQDRARLRRVVGAHAGVSGRRLSPRELDEDDVRVRPGRGSRPRTRTRPAHEEAAAGGRAQRRPRPLPAAAPPTAALLTAVRARELGRRAVVVGDRVAVVGDTGGGPDALGRIVRVEPRTSLLRRTPDDSDPVERAVVANAEVLVVVTALADPVPRPRLVDRCLVAAYDGGLVPLLCLTKDDLAPPRRDARRCTSRSGVEVVVTGPAATTTPGVEVLRAAARRPHERAVRPVRRRQDARWSTGWCRTPTGPSAT